jgi:beta-glucosidase
MRIKLHQLVLSLLALGVLLSCGAIGKLSAADPGAFKVLTPANGAMMCDSRKVTLTWEASPKAVNYEVWLNITRDDYDFMAPGSLLDRYTKVGETKTTTFTTTDLTDRWTYKWYIVAVAADKTTAKSDIGQFSVYLPTLETVDDGVAIVNGCRDLNKNGTIEPYENWRLPVDVRIKDLMDRMTPEEKADQMFYDAKSNPLNGFQMGPCSIQDLVKFNVACAKTRLGIPMISAGDTVIGYQTTYPAQSALAATRDFKLIHQLGNMQREEQFVAGERGMLGPIAEVGTKVLYPRIQEGNGENAYYAAAEVRALVSGIQGGPEINPSSVTVTVKHWPGEGAGGEGGITYDAVTIKWHMLPWKAAIEAGAGQIMPGYANAAFIDPNGSGAGDSPLVIKYLRDLGYNGVICTDWLPSGAWVNAGKAGSDVNGGAGGGGGAGYANAIGMDRVNAANAHILSLKFRMGLFENPYGDPDKCASVWHTKEKVELTTQAAREAMTLIKNENALPLKLAAGDNLVVAGLCDDGAAYSFWNSFFHANFGSQTIFGALKTRGAKNGVNVFKDSTGAVAGTGAAITEPIPANVKAAVVVVGEKSYTHRFFWPIEQNFITDDQLQLIKDYKAKNIPVIVVVILPRPYVISEWQALADAIVIAYRPGECGGTAVAELLFGDYKPQGKLPWQLPSSMDQVGGDDLKLCKEQWDLPYDLGATDAERKEIRAKIDAGVDPGSNWGKPLYPYGFGFQDFNLADTTPPLPFKVTSPSGGAVVKNMVPTLKWEAAADPETGINGYNVWLDRVKLTTTMETSLALNPGQLSNGQHAWYVEAKNWTGAITRSDVGNFTYSDDAPPLPFNLLSPVAGAEATTTPKVAWQVSYDAESSVDRYEVYVDDAKVATLKDVVGTPSAANLALKAPAVVSSEQAGNTGTSAVDGAVGTRWESKFEDPQTLTVDLGKAVAISSVVIRWETAAAAEYTLQVSTDGTAWKPLYATTSGRGGVETLKDLNGYGRFIRLTGTSRTTAYGYSIFEFEVYGNPVTEYQLPTLKPGAHTWSVIAFDKAGNKQTAGGTGTFTSK